MRPTKEECLDMLIIVESIQRVATPGYVGLARVADFLKRCQRSLPSKATVEKDRKRKRKVK